MSLENIGGVCGNLAHAPGNRVDVALPSLDSLFMPTETESDLSGDKLLPKSNEFAFAEDDSSSKGFRHLAQKSKSLRCHDGAAYPRVLRRTDKNLFFPVCQAILLIVGEGLSFTNSSSSTIKCCLQRRYAANDTIL